MQFIEWCYFLKQANYLCLHSLLDLFEASKPEWSHDSLVLSLLGSWHCGIYTDCSYYFLVVLSSKLRYILTGFFFLQAFIYVFAFFWRVLVGETSCKYCLMKVLEYSFFKVRFKVRTNYIEFFSGLLWCVSLLIR